MPINPLSMLSCVFQAAALRDKSNLSEKISETERSVTEQNAELATLKQQVEALNAECAALKEQAGKESILQEEVAALRAQLEDSQGQVNAERLRCEEMSQVLGIERRERDVTLMRNAEVSQQVKCFLVLVLSEFQSLHSRPLPPYVV